jgi:CubicO group peptidase (beta-lactamase class C family)
MELRSGRPEEAGMLPERIDRARDLCATWVKQGHTPALSVCVARRGVVVLDQAFGVLGPEPGAPAIANDSLFPLSSVTKPIMATVVMQLVEDGRIALNRPVRDYIPEIPAGDADEMLVHHLLTHTSGYVFYDEEPFASHATRKVAVGFTLPEVEANQHPLHAALVDIFLDAPLARRPGKIMIYSGQNYEVLSEIVRRVSRRPHWELAQERIFDPLGMQDTFWIVPESEAGRVVQRPLESVGGAPENPFNQGFASRQMQESPYGGAGVFSTPRDMATFAQLFLQGGRYGDERILSPAAVAAMTRDQIPGIKALFAGNDRDRASWGYGWGVESPTKWGRYRGSLRSLGSFDHGGMGGTFLWVDPAQELVGAYFEVCMVMKDGEGASGKEQLWNCDLFQNVVASAVED